MTWLRSAVYNLAFTAWTGFLCIIMMWALMLPRPKMVALMRWYLGTVDVLERVVLGLRFRVVGLEHVPELPFVVACKHQSTWETQKLPLIFLDPAVVYKQELGRIPIWGWFMARAKMIAIERTARSKALTSMVRQANARAQEGRPVIIFPQGTRIAPGVPAPYHPGVAALYGALGLPVVPVAVNSGLFWPRHSFVKKSGTVTVEILTAIQPGLNRKAFMERLETELEAASTRLLTAPGVPGG
ncbi:MAG: 1-acyl-sn-glycerol-3-phosphate acyltransferase [Rhodospirillaceae bacterium]|nr:1-acyl-sn-glycerol-3-phosphate acyltransferase [Rhodospirillaceae bacterium]MCA8933530.1 1-acyl-sn-glycerol-3-phosphate acyltransferase [Rhodospirillaceae bacterium]